MWARAPRWLQLMWSQNGGWLRAEANLIAGRYRYSSFFCPSVSKNLRHEVTTDWRTVLGELVHKRLKNPLLEQVFPDYAMPNFLGVFQEGI